jgi:hypothetical protein
MLACVAPATAESVTVRGLLVDEFCSKTAPPHDNHDNKTQAEMESCALECARKGDPVVLLTADGKVYRITGGLAANRNAKLIPHMSRTVEITGEVTERGGRRQIDADVVKSVK